MASYSHVSASFDSGTMRDHFRMAVAIKACETDQSYPAVGLSDYAGMTPVASKLLPASGGHASHRPLVRCFQYLLVAQRVSDRSMLLDALNMRLNVALLSHQTTLTTFCSCIR